VAATISLLTLWLSVGFFIPQTSSRTTVILAIGDSMTAGFGVDVELSYPAQLEKALNKTGGSYRVVNQGVTASTTAQALGRLDRAMASNPDVVIIQLGGNDASQGISQEVSRANILRIIQRFKPGGARIFLAGGRFRYQDELAKSQNIPVIPFLEGVAGNPELLLSDGVHPNGDGYAVVVKNVLKVLEPFLDNGRSQRRTE
jgi:acyl-CoA thioesterase-1